MNGLRMNLTKVFGTNTMNHLFEQFILGNARSAWIVTDELKIYVRKSHRMNPRTKLLMSCFDIANVIATHPGRGHFTEIHDKLIPLLKVHRFDAIYAESVNNKAFRSWFIRHGYEPMLAVSYNEGNWNAFLYLED